VGPTQATRRLAEGSVTAGTRLGIRGSRSTAGRRRTRFWTYEHPLADVAEIAGHLALDPNPFDLIEELPAPSVPAAFAGTSEQRNRGRIPYFVTGLYCFFALFLPYLISKSDGVIPGGCGKWIHA
jgi:hypothetical protein